MYLDKKALFKHVRFTNKFYRVSDDKIYNFDDKVFYQSDYEVIQFKGVDCICIDCSLKLHYYISLESFKNNESAPLWYASVEDLCALSDSPKGWIGGCL